MRLNELFEDKMTDPGYSDAAKDSLPTGTHYPQMDNYYELYRFGVSMASSPREQIIKRAAGDSPVIYAYTSGEEDIIKATEKAHGMSNKGLQVGPHGSKEHKSINTASTVAAIKRNKYGV